ncbi:hypothetical protein BEN47_08985 [Hymenobacter lapidarius]|uniref:HEPN domain-containing protein n=1 Tax=Hymenobacter lapidarius TaxID=1908237 RepID=A0A1G1TC56_9BACT|nr:hypothetical protein [Hymenobacter lapidarius]OGX88463.1 hypothetical protein BEN47_08985 [Hymenobacter lapidarius]
MLTIEKLSILMKFNWDDDQFSRGGSTREKQLLADVDWGQCVSLLQDLILVTKHLAATEYTIKTHARLLAVCADEQTAQTLLGYASTL